MKLWLSLLLALVASACAAPSRSGALEVHFLTREGCKRSPIMRERMAEVRELVDFELDVVYVDVNAVDAKDYRTGFGTPTLLIRGQDLFDKPRPEPATPT